MSTPRTEEYLEALFKLQAESDGPVNISRLAEHMGLSVPSASEMMKKLSQNGAISYNKRREVSLTEQGHLLASGVIRRHRLSERFLTDTLGLSWEEVHDEACRLEHVISPLVEKKLDEHLGNPKTCPHGHPIPSASGKIEKIHVVSLADIETGAQATVSMVYEEDIEVLKYLANLNLKPGVRVTVIDIAPFGGPITLEIDNATHAIGPELAAKIMVEPV